MPRSDVLLPAPGRGQYDRRAPRERRIAEQKERLVEATALAAVHEPPVSVSSIVRRAGVGRNTFYEYFDDIAHAVEAAESAALRHIEKSLSDAESNSRTPVERWRSLARAWLTFAATEPESALLVLGVDVRAKRATSKGAAVLEAALLRSLETLKSAGVTSPPASAERLLAVAAVGEAFARACARHALAVSPAGMPQGVNDDVERERLERSLVDVAVRLLR
jgi:AcrR family transcriptional regulator